MSFLKSLKSKIGEHMNEHESSSSRGWASEAPPEWVPAPEQPHAFGKYRDAPEDEYESAETFCQQHPPEAPRLISSGIVDRINTSGCKAWGMQYPSMRFTGHVVNPTESKGTAVVKITTSVESKDACLLSDIPILAGLYEIQGKAGVYYEVTVNKMESTVAVGTACRPYPPWRLPGWNRLSAALHLDDLRKFFEDPDGGRDYTDQLQSFNPGDVIGCGYELATGALFYTYNGVRLPPAFTGLYMPRHNYDVYAAIGIDGESDLEVNFGGDYFRWTEGNEWAWRVEGHVGRLGSTSAGFDEQLPSYNELTIR